MEKTGGTSICGLYLGGAAYADDVQANNESKTSKTKAPFPGQAALR